jgi:hypothetical protein
MRFSTSGCGLFAVSLVGAGLTTWGSWAARNFCRDTAERFFQKVINIRQMNLTASIGFGPLLPIHLVNFTFPIQNAYEDNPAAMSDDATLAGNICLVGTLVPAAIILALALGIGGLAIHNKHQLDDALGRDVTLDDDRSYTSLSQ